MIKVLVTNDDGIDAHGLLVLVEALAKHADVYVVAPATQQSGKSHSITFMREVTPQERDVKGAVAAWVLDGTPADCVMWAIDHLKDEEGITLDFVISGINLGYNVGLAAYYSGTVAGAREGSINGIRSIALSVGGPDALNAEHFDYILGLLPQLMEMSGKIDPGTILSVNAPDIPSWEVKGVRVAETAPCGYGLRFFFTRKENGNYQMGAGPAESNDEMRYDMDWCNAGYVAVTPIPTSLTDPVALMRLKGLTLQTDCLTVIIDPQERMPVRMKNADGFIRNLEKLAHSVSRMGGPLIIAESYDMGDVLPQVKEYAGEAETVRHIHPDVWTSPDLEKYVASIDCRKILIAGAATNVELLQTVPGFLKRGYKVVVLEDCCDSPDRLGHELAMEMLREYGCTISTLETEVMQMAGSCTKQVLDAVKNILLT
ncbi:MAG: 5'/3'-nucleotidase SurE [Oscillospiraceae bacterium]|nr:5'/3'-nucleotidase SurE [Oscillospiraceae bacterium]